MPKTEKQPARSLLDVAQLYTRPGMRVTARVGGLPPGLLMHSSEAMVRSAEAEGEFRTSGNGKRAKFIPTHEQEAEWGAYRDQDGHLELYEAAVHRMLIEAGKQFKKPKSRSSVTREVASGIRPEPANGTGFPLLTPDDRPIDTYEVHVARAVVNRAAIRRARPLIPEWEALLVFDIDEEAIPVEMFASVLGYGLARVGLGDWRPEKSGRFGRARVLEMWIGDDDAGGS
jgi:hypothetical protein